MNSRLISLIVPTRNRAHTFFPDLLDTVEDLRVPAGWKLEIVVCDDASSPVHAEEYEWLCERHELSLVRHDMQRGVAAARNSAFLASHGEYVVDVDDDDLLTPNSLTDRIRAIEEHPEQPWFAGNILRVNEQLQVMIGKHSSRDPFEERSPGWFFEQCLAGLAFAWSGTRTYKREALLNVGPWDTTFRVAEDYEHWLRLAAVCGDPVWVDSWLLLYRDKDKSLGIDAVRSGEMAATVKRVQDRWRGATANNLPEGLPVWDDQPEAKKVL